jgi:hypothetical protein
VTIVAVAVHLPDVNGIPADDTVNTFWFRSNTAGDGAALSVAALGALPDFYNTGTTPAPMGGFLAKNLDRGANKCIMRSYTLNDGTDGVLGLSTHVAKPYLLGAPTHTGTFTLTAPASVDATDLPRECAAALSYTAGTAGVAEDVPGGVPGPKGDTRPASDRRGRLYLGPLNTLAIGAGTNGPGLSVGFRTAAAAAAKALADAIIAVAIRFAWVVFSRALGVAFPIINGWIDDAFDTIRSRGILASTRTLFTV